MNWIAFLVIGLVVGLIARAVVPGRQSMGLVGTTALGIGGAFVGGWISTLIYGGNWQNPQPTGLLFSVAGAVVVLFAAGGIARRVRA